MLLSLPSLLALPVFSLSLPSSSLCPLPLPLSLSSGISLYYLFVCTLFSVRSLLTAILTKSSHENGLLNVVFYTYLFISAPFDATY